MLLEATLDNLLLLIRETVTLHYDGKKLEPFLETIVQDDPPLKRVWGEKIYRVTLRERKAAVKGNYTFTLVPEKE